MRLPARAAAWAGARRQTAWMDEFIPAARWDGARNDFVFKTGELGTGYYRDIPAAAPAAALAVSSDDAQLQAELDQLGLAAPRSAEPASEQDSEVFDELRGASKPQELAHRAKAAFQAAELLARGDGDAACAPQSSEVLVPAGLKDCSTGGATGGRDCPHPDALAKYKECVTLYTDALQHRPMEVGDPDLSSEDRSNYFSSRAEARIRLAQFRAAVHDCDFAIALSPASVTQATAEKRKRRAASMAAQFSKRAEETANNTLTSAAETIKQNKDLAKELSELDPETAKGGLKSMTLMAAVTKLKNRGNEAFGAQQWATAAGDYHAAIRVIALAQEEARRERDAEREAHLALDGDDYMSEMIETVEVKEAWPGEALNLRNLHGNLAAALLGLEDYKGAEESAYTALELDCMWGKARYRLGLAIEGCAQGELCRGPEHKTTAVAKFREAHAAFAAALALAEGADKASRASMGRVETQLRELGATAQEHQNTM